MMSYWLWALQLNPDFERKNCQPPSGALAAEAISEHRFSAMRQAKKSYDQQVKIRLEQSSLEEYSAWLNHLESTETFWCVEEVAAEKRVHIWTTAPTPVINTADSAGLTMRDWAGLLGPLY